MSETVAPRIVIAQLVETMRALAGSHPGFRPVHAKGIVCAGTFRGTREARRISRRCTCKARRSPPSCASLMAAAIRTCTMASPICGRWP